MRDVRYIIQNAARLGAGKELVRKAVGKYLEPTASTQDVQEWCTHHATDIAGWLPADQTALWEEAEEFAERLQEEARGTLKDLGVELGGGGHYGLLYFLTRQLRPEVVVETGVAAGYSSKAILTAMTQNQQGRLHSSDFPYCRLENPEKYIGILVDQPLRDRWSLHIKGDRANIPTIVGSLKPKSVSLFHYDSDKSYSGREFAYQALSNHLSDDCVCVFDDIQNNWHFRDLVEGWEGSWRVFEFGGKYLGLIQRSLVELA